MDKLSPDQAQALWDAGGFIILSDLPEGSEFGIDGTFHVIRKFSGIKFLPPGLHLITWSPPIADSGPSTIPLRSSILRWFEPKERVLMRYDHKTENIEYLPGSSHEGGVISDDSLKGLDKELAAYPFEGLGSWRSLLSQVTPEVVDRVMRERKEGRLDGMTGVEGIEEEDARLNTVSGDSSGKVTVERGEGEGRLGFPVVDPKRSWRDGAVGEEITKYSKDKSWQLANIAKQETEGEDGDLRPILGYLQLAFIFLLHLSSYSSLTIYQRLLTLFTRSPALLSSPTTYLPSATQSAIRKIYTSLIYTLAAQLGALPKNAFEMELPEMDLFYLEEIEHLRIGLGAILPDTGGAGGANGTEGLVKAWETLRKAGKGWGWDIQVLGGDSNNEGNEGDSEDEEGEYAPQVVET